MFSGRHLAFWLLQVLSSGERGDTGVRESWGAGVLACWEAGMQACLRAGVRACWSDLV